MKVTELVSHYFQFLTKKRKGKEKERKKGQSVISVAGDYCVSSVKCCGLMSVFQMLLSILGWNSEAIQLSPLMEGMQGLFKFF